MLYGKQLFYSKATLTLEQNGTRFVRFSRLHMIGRIRGQNNSDAGASRNLNI